MEEITLLWVHWSVAMSSRELRMTGDLVGFSFQLRIENSRFGSYLSHPPRLLHYWLAEIFQVQLCDLSLRPPLLEALLTVRFLVYSSRPLPPCPLPLPRRNRSHMCSLSYLPTRQFEASFPQENGRSKSQFSFVGRIFIGWNDWRADHGQDWESERAEERWNRRMRGTRSSSRRRPVRVGSRRQFKCSTYFPLRLSESEESIVVDPILGVRQAFPRGCV